MLIKSLQNWKNNRLNDFKLVQKLMIQKVAAVLKDCVRHLQNCRGCQTYWFLNFCQSFVCLFVVGKDFLVIINFLIQLRDFCKIADAWHFQPLCNFGHQWDFTGFLHPVPFCHLSQLAGCGWSKVVWNQIFNVYLT